ncbi:MAG: FAD binding domain-containing protein [Planctomycetota bacterium]
MHLPDIVLHEPADLKEAGSLLARLGPRARVLAGGTDLLNDLRTGRIEPCELVSLARVGGLRGIEAQVGGGRMSPSKAGLRIGALTTIAEMEESPLLSGPFAVLAEAASGMATPQVRNAATVGGNIVGAVPCADMPPVLGVLDASLVLWSLSGSRTVAIASFFNAPRSAGRRDDEILTEILVPSPPERFGASYARLGLRDGNAIAVAGVAASLALGSRDRIAAARLMLAAVAPIPKRAVAAEDALVGRELEEAIDHAVAETARAAEPISDVRGSAAYRGEMVRVLARRALRAAGERAKEAR